MTIEELKKEADALGYYLVRKHQNVEPLLPCFCGCKRRVHHSVFHQGTYTVTLKCCKCDHKVSGPTLAEARRRWNKMITDGEENDTTRS